MLDQVVGDLTAGVDRLAALDLRSLTGSDAAGLAHRLAELADRIAAVRLQALTVVADSGVWGLDGSRSAAAWLARAERSTRAVAGSDLKLATQLYAHLPATTSALREGSVPVGHARAMTQKCLRTEKLRAQLTHLDRGEQFLLAHAHLGLDDFRRFLDAWCYRVDPDSADAAYHDDQDQFGLQLAPTTGGVAVRGFLDPLVGEGLLTALRAEVGIPPAGDPRSTARRMHDALGSVVSRLLGGGQLGWHASVRPSVVVHVPYATLQALAAGPGGLDTGLTAIPPATLQETGQVLPPTVLDRTLCDCALTRVVFGPQGEVLDVGRAQRTFTGPRRRALDAHDGGCMYPDCHAPPCQCEGHHAQPGGWAGGAVTDARHGGILLCSHHHPWVHDHHIGIHRDDRGHWVFTDRHGVPLGTTRPRSLDPGLWDPWDDAA